MQEQAKNIVGWLVLVLGLAIIIWAVWQSYNIFTARLEAPNLFKLAPLQNNTSKDAQSEFLTQQLRQLLPDPQASLGLMNLIAWSIFASFAVFAGGKLAQVGGQLLRTKA